MESKLQILSQLVFCDHMKGHRMLTAMTEFRNSVIVD